MHVLILHAGVATSMPCLLSANRPLHKEHILTLGLAILHLLVTQVMNDLVGLVADGRVIGNIATAYITQVLAIADHLLITHGDIT